MDGVSWWETNCTLPVTLWDRFTSYLKDKNLEVFYVRMYYSGSFHSPALRRMSALRPASLRKAHQTIDHSREQA